MDQLNSIMEWIKKHVVAVAAVAVVAVVVLGTWVYSFGVRNYGEAMQERIEALYNQSRTSLSACIDQGNVAAQVTVQEYESLKDILTDVASARYVDAEGNPTNASGVLGGGQLISALSEQYPEIDQRGWLNLQSLVIGCRDDFRNAQDRVFIDAASFEQWKLTDNPFNAWIKDDFPSSTLNVENLATGEMLTGQAALDYMTRVISVAEANEAFESGELGEQDLFGD